MVWAGASAGGAAGPGLISTSPICLLNSMNQWLIERDTRHALC